MLTCRDLVRLVAEEGFGDLGKMRRFEARLHLALCPGCRRYAQQIRRIGAAFRRLADDQRFDEALLRELEARILRERGGR